FSAPKAFTTALHEMASASAPPMRVSQLLANVAAGATKPSEITIVQTMNSTEPIATSTPMSGQYQASSATEPTSISSDGSNAIMSVSFSKSIAHIARETLRTVDPAKALACQSVEKRCSLRNELAAMSLMIFKVKSVMT